MRRIVHWFALVLALVPVPFAIADATRLGLWQEGWALAFGVVYTAILSLAIYWIVRGLASLVLRRRMPKA